MQMFETALGRLVPATEGQAVLEDAILRLLYEFRFHPQNSQNRPMKLESIAYGVNADQRFATAALKALREQNPPLVEEPKDSPGAFRISGAGVRLVRNLPQGLPSMS